MSDTITLTGVVATIPRVTTISGGIALTSFRLASNQRRYDRNTGSWVDGDTNWYTVSAFRQLGANAGISIHKGERVIVNGRMRVRDWTNGDRTGTSVDIEADSLGHDLSWGTTAFARNSSSPTHDAAPGAQPDSDEFPPADAEDGRNVFGADVETAAGDDDDEESLDDEPDDDDAANSVRTAAMPIAVGDRDASLETPF